MAVIAAMVDGVHVHVVPAGGLTRRSLAASYSSPLRPIARQSRAFDSDPLLVYTCGVFPRRSPLSLNLRRNELNANKTNFLTLSCGIQCCCTAMLQFRAVKTSRRMRGLNLSAQNVNRDVKLSTARAFDVVAAVAAAAENHTH